MLISPLPLDTPAAPGFVPSRPLSGGGTTGFSEQLATADSELSEPSFSLGSAPVKQNGPDANETRGPNVPIAIQTPRVAISLKSGPTIARSRQTLPGRNAVATALTSGSGSDTVVASATQAPRPPRTNRPPESADENAKDSSRNDALPALLPAQAIPAVAGATHAEVPGARALVSNAPATAASAPATSEEIPAAPGYAERAENQMAALAAERPLLKDALVAAPTPDVAADDTEEGGVEQLAFAVKVQPGKSMPALPRIAALGSASTAESAAQKSSVNPTGPEANAGDSAQDSKVRAARPGTEDHSNESSADTSEANKKTGPGGDAKQNFETADGSSTLHSGALIEEPSRATGTAAVSGSTAASKNAGPGETVAPEPLQRPTASMKDISVRVESAQGQNVDIRIVQRAGDLQIAVKADDTNTTQGLRQGLTELSNRLNESGYQAETWRPGHAAAAPENAAEPGNSSHHQPPSGDSQSNSGSSQQNRGQRDNNPSNRPRWIQELESNLATTSKGQLNGLIS